jgi:acyl carrier protein
MTGTIESRLLRILQDEVGPAALDPTASFADLGMDSLDLLSLVNKIEEEFGVTIPLATLVDFDSVRQLLEWLERQ